MTDACHLEALELRHAPALLSAALESVASVSRWLPWCRSDLALADVEQWILATQADRSAGRAYEFAVIGPSGRYLGGGGVNAVNAEHRMANVGYWIRAGATGAGFATQAVRALVRWAYEHTRLNRLEIVAAVDNEASCRVAEKAGAVFEAVARDRLCLHGQFHDARVYVVTRQSAAGITD